MLKIQCKNISVCVCVGAWVCGCVWVCVCLCVRKIVRPGKFIANYSSALRVLTFVLYVYIYIYIYNTGLHTQTHKHTHTHTHARARARTLVPLFVPLLFAIRQRKFNVKTIPSRFLHAFPLFFSV